jgi:hypothetical protein
MSKQISMFELRCPRCAFSSMIEIKLGILLLDVDQKILELAYRHNCRPSRFSYDGRKAIEKNMQRESQAAVVKADIARRLQNYRQEKIVLQDELIYDTILSDLNLNWEDEEK